MLNYHLAAKLNLEALPEVMKAVLTSFNRADKMQKAAH